MDDRRRCKTCGDVLRAPTYRDGEEWFCSLDCYQTRQDAREMPDPGPRD
jgi:hypothetical protein